MLSVKAEVKPTVVPGHHPDAGATFAWGDVKPTVVPGHHPDAGATFAWGE
ncbi:MAG TPA: hypothetical protein VGI96_21145 [Streptosporangiaceae bacterium]|jgi:hypothetical protein